MEVFHCPSTRGALRGAGRELRDDERLRRREAAADFVRVKQLSEAVHVEAVVVVYVLCCGLWAPWDGDGLPHYGERGGGTEGVRGVGWSRRCLHLETPLCLVCHLVCQCSSLVSLSPRPCFRFRCRNGGQAELLLLLHTRRWAHFAATQQESHKTVQGHAQGHQRGRQKVPQKRQTPI